jgi:hypothetical protein
MKIWSAKITISTAWNSFTDYTFVASDTCSEWCHCVYCWSSENETKPTSSQQAHVQVYSKHSILLMWADQYLRNALQLKFWNSVKLTHVLLETLERRVNTKYCSSARELISKFPLRKLCGTYIIPNNICWLLQAVMKSFELTDHCLTKTLRGLSPLLLMPIVDTRAIPNSELTAEQNQIDWTAKLNTMVPNYGPGAFALICCTEGIVLIATYLLIH